MAFVAIYYTRIVDELHEDVEGLASTLASLGVTVRQSPPRQVLPRERILETVWGYDFDGNDNVLEVYIGYLRKKTETAVEARLIQTIRGVGYVIREA